MINEHNHSTEEEEIIDFAKKIYDGLNSGNTRDAIQLSVASLIQNINPNVSSGELELGVIFVESLIIATLCTMISDGVLIKLEDDNKIMMKWEGKVC